MKDSLFNFGYQRLMKPVLFQMDPEKVHERFTGAGMAMGGQGWTRFLMGASMRFEHLGLRQKAGGIEVVNPVGLSAGFDYDGKMSAIMPSVGFGFESIGTVTYGEYGGNTQPRLGRLPESKSLMVNKGFKSEGIKKVLHERVKMVDDRFGYGISIGATNSPRVATAAAQKKDIVKSFEYLVGHRLAEKFAYYEVNISCPNVAGSGNLANAKDLDDLLGRIVKTGIKRPLWVKFQLEIEWKEAQKLIKIMIKHGVAAVVMANLLKNRKSKDLKKDELAQFDGLKGNFSGKPTWKLSNDLIGRTYKEFGKEIDVVGVGGVFSAEDAYTKIQLGASLVQLITGMVYQGPQLIGQINKGLVKLMERDGFENIAEAVGSAHSS